MPVRSQVLGEVVDPLREERDLDLGRPRVGVGAAVLADDLQLLFLGEAHCTSVVAIPQTQHAAQGRTRAAEPAVAGKGSSEASFGSA